MHTYCQQTGILAAAGTQQRCWLLERHSLLDIGGLDAEHEQGSTYMNMFNMKPLPWMFLFKLCHTVPFKATKADTVYY